MASDRIEELRTRQFDAERRGGYDRAQVDAYLADFADWLETDEAKATVAQREIERVGTRIGATLSAAQQSADETLAEARAEADAERADAEREAGEQRHAADAYAGETRATAEADARRLREAAEADAAKSRAEAEEHARLTIREADDLLQRAAQEAADRTAGIEADVAKLAKKRDALLTNLGQLVTWLQATIDGPGSEDIALPERSATAAVFAEAPPAAAPRSAVHAPAAAVETPPARHEPVRDEPQHDDEPESGDDPGNGEEPEHGEEPAFKDEEPETRAESVPAFVEPVPEPDPDPEPVAEETRPYQPVFDIDDDLYDDGRPPEPLPSGRDPQRRPQPTDEDPTTDEQKMSELL